MFKMGSVEQELLIAMQKSLITSQLDNKFSLDKLAKAADYINTAAELLDDTGFKVEADMLTKVLQRLANDQDNNNTHDINDEVVKVLESPGAVSMPEEIIIEPLEQEIDVAPSVHESGKFPLSGDYYTGEIFEKPELLEFNSIAEKLAAKFAAKKKV